MIKATVIRDSINNHDNRLIAMRSAYQNFIMSKINPYYFVRLSSGCLFCLVFSVNFVNSAIGLNS